MAHPDAPLSDRNLERLEWSLGKVVGYVGITSGALYDAAMTAADAARIAIRAADAADKALESGDIEVAPHRPERL